MFTLRISVEELWATNVIFMSLYRIQEAGASLDMYYYYTLRVLSLCPFHSQHSFLTTRKLVLDNTPFSYRCFPRFTLVPPWDHRTIKNTQEINHTGKLPKSLKAYSLNNGKDTLHICETMWRLVVYTSGALCRNTRVVYHFYVGQTEPKVYTRAAMRVKYVNRQICNLACYMKYGDLDLKTNISTKYVNALPNPYDFN